MTSSTCRSNSRCAASRPRAWSRSRSKTWATDERFTDHPLVVGEPHLRFYAGAPLIARSGAALGALCVMSPQPHRLAAEQRRILQQLARLAIGVLESAAVRSEQQGFFDLSAEMFAILHRSGRVLRANHCLADALGVSIDDLQGQRLHRHVEPSDHQRLDQTLARCAAGTPVDEDPIGFIHRSGERRALKLRWRRGEYDRIHLIGHDVTDEQRVQARLRLLEQAVASSRNPIIVCRREIGAGWRDRLCESGLRGSHRLFGGRGHRPQLQLPAGTRSRPARRGRDRAGHRRARRVQCHAAQLPQGWRALLQQPAPVAGGRFERRGHALRRNAVRRDRAAAPAGTHRAARPHPRLRHHGRPLDRAAAQRPEPAAGGQRDRGRRGRLCARLGRRGRSGHGRAAAERRVRLAQRLHPRARDLARPGRRERCRHRRPGASLD